MHAASPKTSAAAPVEGAETAQVVEDIMEWCSFGSVEGFAAGAGVLGVRVIDREALTLDGVGEVDRCAAQVGHAHAIDDDLNAVEERIASPSSVRSSKYSW